MVFRLIHPPSTRAMHELNTETMRCGGGLLKFTQKHGARLNESNMFVCVCVVCLFGGRIVGGGGGLWLALAYSFNTLQQ